MEDHPSAPLLDARKLVNQWLSGIRNIHIAHTRACADYQVRGQLLGLAVTLLAAVTGSTVFAAASGSTNRTVLYVAGGLSVLSALLAAAQTYLEYPAWAARHAAAAIEYGELRRDFEAALLGPAADLPGLLTRIRTRWGEIEAKYPIVSQRRYDQARRQAAGMTRQKPPAAGEAATPPS